MLAHIADHSINSVDKFCLGTALGSWHLPKKAFGYQRCANITKQVGAQLKTALGRRLPSIGLDAAAFGTHTIRRTKAILPYRRTKNIRAIQLLLGHTKLESTVRYLGIEGHLENP